VLGGFVIELIVNSKFVLDDNGLEVKVRVILTVLLVFEQDTELNCEPAEQVKLDGKVIYEGKVNCKASPVLTSVFALIVNL
jgi:hypothetical protein